MKLVHVRNKELQTSTFTANAAFTMENGVQIDMEDGTPLELDGTVSWSIQIIHAQSKTGIAHVRTDELFSTNVRLFYTLVNQNGDTLMNQDGDTLIAGIVTSWPTTLVHV